MKCKVHRFDLKRPRIRGRLEQFLDRFDGGVAAGVPNITVHVSWTHKVDFLLIVEKIGA